MYFVALATDYDGTLACEGVVDDATLQEMRLLKESGRRLLLVTGRELPDLQRVFPALDVFDLVVAENGALLYDPATKEEKVLSTAPPAAFIARLEKLGVAPLSVGRSIIATWEPHETAVLEAIRDLGLEMQITFNKGAVMVLPSNVNKATGLKAALDRMSLSAHNVVGIGDAENDHAFLVACGCAVAVDNALPSIKSKADWVTRQARSEGVVELAQLLRETDLSDARLFKPRASPSLGRDRDGKPVELSPFAGTALIVGSSGGGKTTAVLGFLESVQSLGLQYCIIDPEGDYAHLDGTVAVGGPKQVPRIEEVVTLLARPDVNVSINLLAISGRDRPRFFAQLLPELMKLRAEKGRPHWLIIDEAHHLMPAKWRPTQVTLPKELPATILVTVHPEELAPDLLSLVETAIGVGDDPRASLDNYFDAIGLESAAMPPGPPQPGSAYVWHDAQVREVSLNKPEAERRRHARKYAEGELGDDRSFYFRGPDNALNLRAQNLAMFVQMAEGVDDSTWLHHLGEGDYSAWFRHAIKDDDLADEAEVVERDRAASAKQSRARIKELIDSRYTVPAKTA